MSHKDTAVLLAFIVLLVGLAGVVEGIAQYVVVVFASLCFTVILVAFVVEKVILIRQWLRRGKRQQDREDSRRDTRTH